MPSTIRSSGDPPRSPCGSHRRGPAGTDPGVLAFLAQAANYPDAARSVTAIETRLSRVFLTERHAWKLKRPIHDRLVDFRGLAERLADCRAEVELNAALAPGVYLGVVALTRAPHGALAFDGPGEPVEYLVRMRRLPASASLEARLAAGTARAPAVDAAAERLAAFHAQAPRIAPLAPGDVAAAIRAESDELAGLPLGTARTTARLRDGLHAWLARNEDILRARPRVDGHGDLRPQHVYLTQPPVIIDRLTFLPALRRVDPLDEIAFLALDCERLGAAWVGPRFLAAWQRQSGDRPPPGLLDFYRARRGLLWALLSARHLAHGDNRRPWRRIARAYLYLALTSLPGGRAALR